jgi:simple sugar transport system ATP-binding protein
LACCWRYIAFALLSDQPILNLSRVSKRYGTVQANKAIDLSVKPGSIHAVLGENGAGKSTLMKLIYGVEHPDEGVIFWNGEPVHLSRPSDAQALGIGMVFQHFSLFETLNVVQNVSLMVPGKTVDLARKINELGERFGLTVDPNAMVHTLSVGERQRVEIIRCLLLNPKLLILDEPTSVLPPQSVKLLFETLRKLQADGTAILFISHKLEEIRELCDEATVLRGGEVTGLIDPREHDARALAQMMIGREMPHLGVSTLVVPGEMQLRLSNLSHPRSTRFGTTLENIIWICVRVRLLVLLEFLGMANKSWLHLSLVKHEHVSPDMIIIKKHEVGRLGPMQRRELGFAFVPENAWGAGQCLKCHWQIIAC